MKALASFWNLRVSFGFAAVCAFLPAGFVSQSDAQIVTLTDNNSIAQIDVGSPQGMFYWAVLSQPGLYQNQLHQQWFWYRVGSDPERSIDTISAPVISGLTPSTLTTTYYDSLNRFNIGVTYTLMGGSSTSGTADIAEQIEINNTSGSALDFHFFQYSDFDVSGTAGADTIVLSTNAFTHRINQADQFEGANLVEVVNSPNAHHGEAGLVPTTLVKLNDAAPTILNDSQLNASGDVAWALQWDVNISAGGSYLISKDKLLAVQYIPEPTSLSLASLGFIAGVLQWRRRAAR
ncbi:MAG: hypothetical protein MUE94_01270 [Verrucomicrobia bacterium]|jgi:hypothetical protein|nr:hypothetical protein [Verrucomicrobiota bacterium]